MRGKERKFEYDSWRRNTLIVYKCHNLEIENMERTFRIFKHHE